LNRHLNTSDVIYAICGRGEIAPSLIFLLFTSFFLFGIPSFEASQRKSISPKSDRLDATIYNVKRSKVYPYQDGYEIKVRFEDRGTIKNRKIYCLKKVNRGTQVELFYGYDKLGAIVVTCPELESTYFPFFIGSLVNSSPIAIVFLLCSLHIFSTVKTGLRRLRLFKYGVNTEGSFVSKKRALWIRTGGSPGTDKKAIYKVIYEYSVNGSNYNVKTEINNEVDDFNEQIGKIVTYDPESPKNALLKFRLLELIKSNTIIKFLVVGVCFAMSLFIIYNAIAAV
jgi:hypothetical protein